MWKKIEKVFDKLKHLHHLFPVYSFFEITKLLTL